MSVRMSSKSLSGLLGLILFVCKKRILFRFLEFALVLGAMAVYLCFRVGNLSCVVI